MASQLPAAPLGKWHKYLSGQVKDVVLRDAVLASWQRSAAANVERAEGRGPLRVSDAELARRRAQARALIEAARPHLEWLSASLADVCHVAYLTDADGIILESRGDLAAQEGLGLDPGCDWSEPAMGTNGAGTALATGRPAAVVGAEHYLTTYEDCTCTAAPVRDPRGEVIGALDVSTSVKDGSPERLRLVSYVASMIEQELARRFHAERHERYRSLAGALESRERELLETNRRLQLILDNAPTYIYLYDAEDRFIDVNRGWQQHVGAAHADVVGRHVSEVFPPETAAQFAANNKRVREENRALEFEETYRVGDRVQTYLSVKVPLRDAGGCPIGVCGMTVDITARKHAEEGLRAAKAALEREARRKDRFLGTLGHELRNPLAAVAGAAHVVQALAPPGGELAEAGGLIERQVGQLTAMVDELLDLSRIAHDRIVLKRQALRFDRVIEWALEAMQSRLRDKALRVDAVLPAGGVWVEGDWFRLIQVVENLLDNALKFTPRGGAIRLTLEREGAQMRLRVRDTGPGVAPELREDIFRPFVQSGARGEGLGIGLALVKRLVAMHGGSIEVETPAEGAGAQFLLRLPALEEEPPLEAPREAKRARGGAAARRVLVVDDDPDVARSLALSLGGAGHEVRVAHDAAGALAQARALQPEVVLLDLSLPVEDGYAIAQRLRGLPEARAAMLVAVTGGGSSAAARAAASGFDHFLLKPVPPAKLTALLARSPVRPRAAGPRRVLVIEDNEDVRASLRMALETEGYEVTLAAEGAEALERQRSAPADVVITDIFMPGREGIETIEALRREYPAARIIAISGDPRFRVKSDYLAVALEAGAAAAFRKPLDLKKLLEAVAR